MKCLICDKEMPKVNKKYCGQACRDIGNKATAFKRVKEKPMNTINADIADVIRHFVRLSGERFTAEAIAEDMNLDIVDVKCVIGGSL